MLMYLERHKKVVIPIVQVTATNNAFTSNSSEVANITFDESGDVDALANVSMRRLSPSSVYLNWFPVRGVEGYKVQVRLPSQYPKREPIDTKLTNITRKSAIIIVL